MGKTSGGKVQYELSISEGAYKQAKDKLKGQGLVGTGRGRGGTIWAIDGAEPPPEPKKITKEERIAFAREEKEAKRGLAKQIANLEQAAREIAEAEHPDADKIEVQVWNVDQGRVFVYPWYGKSAQTHEVYV